MPTLFHYTNAVGLNGIRRDGNLRPSTRATNPRDARHGDGQYLTDVPPDARTPAQLSRLFVGHPFAGTRFTHYLEIDVAGLTVRRGREHVYVVPGDAPLEVRARIVSFGACPPVQAQERP